MLEAEARARFRTRHRPAPIHRDAGIALAMLAMLMTMAAATMVRASLPSSLPRRRLRSPPAAIMHLGVYEAAPRPFLPLVDSVEGFACGSFPRQRQAISRLVALELAMRPSESSLVTSAQRPSSAA